MFFKKNYTTNFLFNYKNCKIIIYIKNLIYVLNIKNKQNNYNTFKLYLLKFVLDLKISKFYTNNDFF